MFLKYMGAMPEYIYASDDNGIFVNLFVGSHASLEVGGKQVGISQQTEYPWDGIISITLEPESASVFSVRIRIPGWAQGVENPFGLYVSKAEGTPVITVCGNEIPFQLENGYAVVSRKWEPGDEIVVGIPMNPRFVTAHPDVKQLNGKVAIACGPVVYSLENIDNEGFGGAVEKDITLEKRWHPELLGGINTIVGLKDGKELFTAIPYYALGNRPPESGYTTWIDMAE